MLYFKPVEEFSSQNPFIEMVYSGFEIPGASSIPHLFRFNVKTFSSFFTRQNDRGLTGELGTPPSVAYDPVNQFLTLFTDEEQKEIAMAFLSAHAIIVSGEDDASDIEQVEDKIGDLLDALDLKLNICKRTEEYVAKYIRVAGMEEAGTQPQHTPEMTFYHDEAVVVTAIAVFMKLISPITGAFIHKYSKVIANEYKESHARAILVKLHSRTYKPLLLKLNNYMTKLVSSHHKDDPTAMYNGNTLTSAARHAVDTAVVKRLVCVSLHKEDGNIIKYLACCGTGTADSQQKNMAANSAAKIIADPVDNDRDEGNTSRMESESRYTAKTADTPIIIAVYADRTWRKCAEQEGIDPEELELARAYYSANPVMVHDITLYLLCMYYGEHIGGGSGIQMLKSSIINDMVATLQLILVKENRHVLAHAITANLTEHPRTIQPNDSLFHNMWTSCAEYAACKRVLPPGFGDREWNSMLRKIANMLMTRTMLYNTAPVVWDKTDPSGKNGVPLTEFASIMQHIMQYVKSTYERGKIE
jgi:hypothetical protein